MTDVHSGTGETGWLALASVVSGSSPRRASWRHRAACIGADTDQFFSSNRREQRAALLVCGGCPVKDACRADAMEFERRLWSSSAKPAGVVGGTTPVMRREIYLAERVAKNSKQARKKSKDSGLGQRKGRTETCR